MLLLLYLSYILTYFYQPFSKQIVSFCSTSMLKEID